MLLLSLLGLPAVICATPVESIITAATVYSDRAVVTRTATVDLKLGENVLLFEHLPSSLMDESLQFSGQGTASATILDVNAESTFLETVPNEKAKALEDELRANEEQIRALDDRTAVLKDERAFVKGMLTSSTEISSAPRDAVVAARPSLDDWQKLYAYSEEALGKIATEIRSIDDQRTDLTTKKDTIQKQLDGLRGSRTKNVKNVKVRIDAATAGQLDVTLKYTIPRVSWTPSYNARLNADDRTIELGYYGLVRNATSEDWKDIALTLSTARPGLGGGAPELPLWIVDVEQREEPAMLAPFSAQAKSIAQSRAEREQQFNTVTGGRAIAGLPLEKEPLEAFDMRAAVEMNATTATFKIPGTVSVPANNSMQKVAISSAKLAATLQYEATPKLMETAFLSASAVNTTDYPLLAGPMNTFLDGTFVAASRIKTVMPGEKFVLHLGADEGITVKRKLVNRFSENTGIANGGRRVTYDYLLTFTNNKKTAERVAFKEGLPVSRQEKIEVKLLAPDEETVGTKDNPKEVTRDEDGKLVWRIDLKPAEKREIPLKFSVSYPADISVRGLEQ